MERSKIKREIKREIKEFAGCRLEKNLIQTKMTFDSLICRINECNNTIDCSVQHNITRFEPKENDTITYLNNIFSGNANKKLWDGIKYDTITEYTLNKYCNELTDCLLGVIKRDKNYMRENNKRNEDDLPF